MNNLILENCKLSSNNISNIIIENGKIKKIKKTISTSDKNSDKIINLKEKIIIPGLIDTHVHFRDPGLTHKENWKTGSMAAINGGYTTVVDMPNTLPPTDTLKNFKEKKNIALKKSYCDFGLQAGVKTKKDVNEILTENPTAYKIFMDLYTDEQLDKLFSYIKDTNKVLSLHCEDKSLIEYYTSNLKKNPENNTDTKAYSNARSEIAELISVHTAIKLGIKYNLKLHLCHISSKQTLNLIEAYSNKLNYSLEVTPHHLFLNTNTYDEYGVKAKTNPPLRNKKYAINLNDLTKVNSIATDHAPHTLNEKTKDTWTAAAGIPGLEVTMKLLLTQLNENKINLNEIIRLTSSQPAEIFNIKNKGQIKEGYDADITVLDLKKEGKINIDEFYTEGRYTPFENKKYVGDVCMTINRGQVVMENNQLIKHEAKYIS